MKMLDISWPITAGMTEYKNRGSVKLAAIRTFEEHGMRETMLSLHSHTGTHIDAPSHFLRDGKSSEFVLLEALNGPCRVLDMTHITDCITQDDLVAHNIQEGERILFKTKNSARSATEPFDALFVYVAKDAAAYLATAQVACVGIDYLGIERNQPAHETHEILLGNNVVIIEGLRLQDCMPGSYQLWCLPLAVQGVDGVPSRAVLVSN